MATNEFDSLLTELATLQRVRGTSAFAKALVAEQDLEQRLGRPPRIDEIRQVQDVERHPAVAVSTLSDVAPAVARRQAQVARATKERAALDRIMTRATPIMTRRQRFEQTAPAIMAKAMNLFHEGKIGAVEISRIEAKVHALDLAVRP